MASFRAPVLVTLALASTTSAVAQGRLRITPGPLPDGLVSQSYSASVGARGGQPPYSWSVLAGSLPPGLGLNGATGDVSGTPSGVGSYGFIVRLRDSAGDTDSQGYSITIRSGLTVTTSSLPAGQQGVPYSATLGAGGGVVPYTWAVTRGSLPGGLSMGGSGDISGVPAATGNSQFTVTVRDGSGATANQGFSISVRAPSLTISTGNLPGGAVGTGYSASVSASGGVPPLSWSVNGGSMPDGVSMNGTGSIAGTPTRAGSFSFSATVTDSTSATASQSYSINIAAAPLNITTNRLSDGTVGVAYGDSVNANGGTPPYSWSIESGSLPDGVSMTGGSFAGTPTRAAAFPFSVRVTDSAGVTASKGFSITIAPPALAIQTTSLPAGQVGAAYSGSVAASGGAPPYSFSVQTGSLPGGLTLQSDGSVQGTPTSAGTSSFTVRVRDAANGSAAQGLSITIAAPALTVTTASLPGGKVGTAYSGSLAATGGTAPYTWNLESGSLPDGVSLSSGGSLSGTPTRAETFSFSVRVTDAASVSASRGFSITIGAATLSVSTSSLPNGTVGAGYSGSLSAAGGTGPYVWSLESGSLPGGISLNSSGSLSGTPTAAGNFSFGVRVTDATNVSATRGLSIAVGAAALTVSTASLPNGTVGAGYSGSLSATGGTTPYAWSVESGSLPDGVSLSASGSLSGTPTTAGAFPFTVRVTDGASVTASKGLSITIGAAPLSVITTSLPNGTVGVAYSGSVGAAGGTPPYSWSVDSGSLPDGVSLGANGALSGTPTTAAAFSFTLRVTDAANATTMKSYSVTIAPALLAISTNTLSNGTAGVSYSGSLAATGGTAPYVWSVDSGSLPDGVALSGAGVLSGTPTRAGSFTFTARVTDAVSASTTKSFSIGITAAALSISTSALPGGMAGTPYAASLAAAGGTAPYTWSVESGSLPDGLSLGAGGALSGTPTRAGAFSFSARVTDAANATLSKSFTISISSATLTVSTNSLPGGAVGAAYSASLGASGGTAPYTWAVASGSLPDGVSLSGSGSINGTPTRAGTFSFSAQATDAQRATASKSFSITITAPALSVTTSTVPNGTEGAGYNAAVSASGGTPPYAWSVDSGALPDGVSLSASGTLAGTPTRAGSYSFTARVTDAAGGTAAKAFSTSIAPPALSITSAGLTTAVAGISYTGALAAVGGVGPYSWSVANGSMPDGVTLAASGSLSGTPTRSGSFGFLVRVTDSTGASASRSYTITVVAPGLSVTTVTLPSATTGVAYFATVSATGGVPPYVWQQLGGTLPPGLTLGPGGDLTGTPTQAGLFQFSVRVTDASGTTADRDLAIVVSAALTVAACPTDIATVGQPYSGVLSALGGQAPYAWTISAGALPGGLFLNAETGAIAGTPPTAGAIDFTVRVTDRASSAATRACSIRVQTPGGAPPVLVSISPSSLPAGPSEFRVTVSGRNFTAPSSTARGSIVQLNGADLLTSFTSTGQLSVVVPAGITTIPGQFAIRVVTYNPPGEAPLISESVTLTVTPPVLAIATALLPEAVVDAPYEQAIVASGGRQPYVWSIAGGDLPPGIMLDAATGILGGQLATAGTFSFTVQVTDAAAATATRDFTLASGTQLAVASPAGLSPGTVGSDFAQTMSAAGGSAPYQWTILSGALPGGLSFSSGGLLSGTPTEAGTFSFTVRVIDRAGRAASRAYTLVVLPISMPRLNLLGIGDTVNAAQQPRIVLELDAPYPLPLAGRLTAEFAPAAGIEADDRSMQFSTGGRAVDFTIPANQTRAVFPTPELALQTGTVAGSITLGITLRAAGVDLVPSRLSVHELKLNAEAPVVSGVSMNRTASGIEVIVNGFSTNRAVTQATFKFAPAAGSSAAPLEITVPMTAASERWYRDPASTAFGSQFRLVQPFAAQAGSEQVGSVTVTLSNSVGQSQPAQATF